MIQQKWHSEQHLWNPDQKFLIYPLVIFASSNQQEKLDASLYYIILYYSIQQFGILQLVFYFFYYSLVSIIDRKETCKLIQDSESLGLEKLYKLLPLVLSKHVQEGSCDSLRCIFLIVQNQQGSKHNFVSLVTGLARYQVRDQLYSPECIRNHFSDRTRLSEDPTEGPRVDLDEQLGPRGAFVHNEKRLMHQVVLFFSKI